MPDGGSIDLENPVGTVANTPVAPAGRTSVTCRKLSVTTLVVSREPGRFRTTPPEVRR
ncbi:hypothetical protein GCM10011594_01260 [Nakamurella endophytica]|uniref:Uncharacterized protein n=1 Tax=Nakamurella endophytica TaxID=1748367 RepID=A0A917WAV8_9ACTN|nr:hypothetical protein GCM10011594_01260 [Nakamurella endophytica]